MCSGCPPQVKTVVNGVTKVVRGWAYLAGGVNEELSQQRVKHCYNCVHLTGGMVCSLCGCEVHAKTRLPEESCPDKPPKWLPE